MMAWFHALMPREQRFFELFAQHSKAVSAGGEALREMLEGGDAVQRCYQTIMDREHDADVVTRDVLIAVRRTFITPFDRGSVRNLITSMDNAIDQMQKTAKIIMLFDVQEFAPKMREMADKIVQAAHLVEEALPLLRSISKEAVHLSRIAEKITQIEGDADELHDQGLKELYREHAQGNAMPFIIGSEIYDHLEKVVDRFDDVANEIHGIVIEHV